MNFLKIYKYNLFLFLSIAHTIALGTPKIKICLTGRIVSNLQTYGQSFINAAYLSKEENKPSNQIEIKSYFYNNRPLEPINIYHKMLRENCSAIIGFEYLSDLLLITKIQNKDIPLFTSYPSTTKTEKLPKNIFIFMPSYNFLAKKMIVFLQKHYKKLSSILIITEINREEMLKYKEVYSSILNEKNISYSTFDFLENDPLLEQKLRLFINKKSYRFIFLLSGAISSAKIANQMNNHQNIFIGTETYGSSTSPTFFIRINDKLINAYFIRNLDLLKSNHLLLKFVKKYVQKFQTQPTLLAAYTYDSMNIILQSYLKSGSTKYNIIHNVDYTGITGAHIINHAFYRSNDYVILSINKNGYQYEE